MYRHMQMSESDSYFTKERKVSATFVYNGENKLHFDERMILSALI
jgi:hypothetical protein